MTNRVSVINFFYFLTDNSANEHLVCLIKNSLHNLCFIVAFNYELVEH